MAARRAEIEAGVAGLWGLRHAVLAGRARSAILATLSAIEPSGPRAVVLPSNICPDLVIALEAKGHRTYPADISPLTGLVSDGAMAARVAELDGPGVVMPAHLYGFLGDYPRTVAMARARGWFILENDTLAVKTQSAAPFFGDALVTSFGAVKTIEAGGGGAVLTNDAALAARIRANLARFPALDAGHEEAETHYSLLARSLRNGTHPTAPSPIERERLLFQAAPASELSFPDFLLAPLEIALASLPATIAARREAEARWDIGLAALDATLLRPAVNAVAPWRLIRRVPGEGRRDEAVAALRAAGIDAGTNYPTLRRSFPARFANELWPGGEQWEREVLNLWLTPTYDAARIGQAVAVLKEALG